MLPISGNSLSLEMVAEYWSREVAGVRRMPEIYDELLAAFWNGKLAVFGGSGIRVDRPRFLKLLRSKLEHPGFTFVDSKDMVPPKVEKHPDGSVTIDQMEYIVLPEDETRWTNEIVEMACRTLTTMSFDDYHDLLKPGLRLLNTTRESLATYCKFLGYNVPGFWFGDPTRARKDTKSFVGRPSVMRQIEAEMERRAHAGLLEPKLRPEAKALREWCDANIDKKEQIPQVRAIENALRRAYKELSQGGSPVHKT